MAPQPTEDIDLPALGDKIYELLLALWTFVSDLCLAVWSYASEVFLAVWTYPPFETFRNELVAALISLENYVVAHPITSMVIVFLALVVVPGMLNGFWTFILRRLGFRRRGVLRGSYAANYQSTGYGGRVPRDSTFARFQSHGAKSGGRYRTGSPSWY